MRRSQRRRLTDPNAWSHAVPPALGTPRVHSILGLASQAIACHASGIGNDIASTVAKRRNALPSREATKCFSLGCKSQRDHVQFPVATRRHASFPAPAFTSGSRSRQELRPLGSDRLTAKTSNRHSLCLSRPCKAAPQRRRMLACHWLAARAAFSLVSHHNPKSRRA